MVSSPWGRSEGYEEREEMRNRWKKMWVMGRGGGTREDEGYGERGQKGWGN